MPDGPPVTWRVAELLAAFADRSLSPVEVARDMLARIATHDAALHGFVAVAADAALAQARRAEQAYARGERAPLLGIPISIKDAFHVEGLPTTFGSLLFGDAPERADSGAVRRLRAAGAVFTGKTNTAEFGQSATTDNLLGPDTVNPWATDRTSGGSSGGAAVSVATRMSALALGSDGGGSVRIPAALCGVFGIKPTRGLCSDEGGLRAMTDFVSPGPLAWCAADARPMLEVLAGRRYPRRTPRPLVIGYDATPEGRAVEPAIREALDAVAVQLEALGHRVLPIELPLDGWTDVFGPLVLEDEGRERGHLLEHRERLTAYERRSLEAATRLDPADVETARRALPLYRQRISDVFLTVDALLTPVVAVRAFEVGQRPREIDGTQVDALWGAFPFAAPFNVAGTPAASVPCAIADGLPIAAQIVAPAHSESLVLDLAETLEDAIDLDRSIVVERWAATPLPEGRAP